MTDTAPLPDRPTWWDTLARVTLDDPAQAAALRDCLAFVDSVSPTVDTDGQRTAHLRPGDRISVRYSPHNRPVLRAVHHASDDHIVLRSVGVHPAGSRHPEGGIVASAGELGLCGSDDDQPAGQPPDHPGLDPALLTVCDPDCRSCRVGNRLLALGDLLERHGHSAAADAVMTLSELTMGRTALTRQIHDTLLDDLPDPAVRQTVRRVRDALLDGRGLIGAELTAIIPASVRTDLQTVLDHITGRPNR